MGTNAREAVSCLPLWMKRCSTQCPSVLTGVPHLVLEAPKGVLPGHWQPLHRIYLLFKTTAAARGAPRKQLLSPVNKKPWT